MPKVSVIIPTHNRADFLESSIESVLSQTYNDFEVIVVDDNSCDHTHEVVKNFRDIRIRYILHLENKGPSAARNTAIAASKGDFIAFLDDDDEWMPHKLQKQILVLDKSLSNVCGVYTNRLVIDKANKKVVSTNLRSNKLHGNLLCQLVFQNPISTGSLLLKKNCLDQVGYFDESMYYMEDRDLWIRLSMKWDFEYIDEPLTKIHLHSNKLSNNLRGQIAGREKFLEKYHHLLSKDRKNWSKLHILQGAQYCQLKNLKKGRQNIIKGIKIYAFNLNAYLHLFSSILGINAYLYLRRLFSSTQ